MTIEEANKELLPCPFCGGTKLHLRDLAGYEIDCECGINLCNHPEKDKCVSQWNKRASGWKRLEDEKPKDQQECIIFKSHCYWVGTWFEESQTFSGGVQSDLWMPIPLAPGDER